jgi:hypothetical protein
VTTQSRSAPRILLADDGILLRKALAAALSAAGFEPTTADHRRVRAIIAYLRRENSATERD